MKQKLKRTAKLFIRSTWMISFLLASAGLSERSPAAVALKNIRGTGLLRQVESPSLRLESIVVEVNGERRRVEPSVGFSIVRGDLVTVVESWLVDKSRPSPMIIIAGLPARKGLKSADDRSRIVDTARELDLTQSEGGLGQKYAIRAVGSGLLYGETFMTVLLPELISFDIEVNGKMQHLNESDHLVLKPTDKVKVLEIKTNIRGNENVRHDFLDTLGSDGKPVKEIRITRGATVFAKIKVDWQGL